MNSEEYKSLHMGQIVYMEAVPMVIVDQRTEEKDGAVVEVVIVGPWDKDENHGCESKQYQFFTMSRERVMEKLTLLQHPIQEEQPEVRASLMGANFHAQKTCCTCIHQKPIAGRVWRRYCDRHHTDVYFNFVCDCHE